MSLSYIYINSIQQQFNKLEVHIVFYFCSILSMKILPIKSQQNFCASPINRQPDFVIKKYTLWTNQVKLWFNDSFIKIIIYFISKSFSLNELNPRHLLPPTGSFSFLYRVEFYINIYKIIILLLNYFKNEFKINNYIKNEICLTNYN